MQDLQTTIDLPAWEGLPVDVFPVLGPRSFGYTNALGYLSPVQFEDQHAQQTVKPAA